MTMSGQEGNADGTTSGAAGECAEGTETVYYHPSQKTQNRPSGATQPAVTTGESVAKHQNNQIYDYWVLISDRAKDEDQALAWQITRQLQQCGFNGCQDPVPGTSREEYVTSAGLTSDYIITLIGKISPDLVDTLHWHDINRIEKMKRSHDQADHILPVFCMNRYEANVLLSKQANLTGLAVLQAVYTTEDGWMDKIVTRLDIDNLSRVLSDRYNDLLPVWCCPPLRGPMPYEAYWLDAVLPPRFSASVMKWEVKEGNKRLVTVRSINVNNVFILLEQLQSGSRAVIHSPAGYGKSTLQGHITRQWCRGHPALTRFKYLYLLPLRRVHNHTELMERIITWDLHLVGRGRVGEVRRAMKRHSDQILWLLDGYDELGDKEQKVSIINNLMSGAICSESVVLATSRPHCLRDLTSHIPGSFSSIALNTLHIDDIKAHILKIFQDDRSDGKTIWKDISESVVKELLEVPLFMNLVCFLYKSRENTLHPRTSPRKLQNTGSLIDALWGMVLGIKDEKQGLYDWVKFYSSATDNEVNNSTYRLVMSVAEMSFHCLMRKEYVFNSNILNQFRINVTELGELGLLDVQAGVEVTAMFVHALLQEHMAALHMANNDSALQQVLDRLNKPVETEKNLRVSLMERALDPFANALRFAVQMKPDILKEVSKCFHKIKAPALCMPIACAYSNHANYLELSYHSTLVHECKSTELQVEFMQALLTAPKLSTPLKHNELPHLSLPAYGTMLNALGPARCLALLKQLYDENMEVDGYRALLKLPEGRDDILIREPLLLVTLPLVHLQNVTHLTICELAELDVLKYAPQWPITKDYTMLKQLKLHHVTFCVSSLPLLLQMLRPSRKCHVVLRECPLRQETTVKKVITYIEVDMLTVDGCYNTDDYSLSMSCLRELLLPVLVVHLRLQYIMLKPEHIAQLGQYANIKQRDGLQKLTLYEMIFELDVIHLLLKMLSPSRKLNLIRIDRCDVRQQPVVDGTLPGLETKKKKVPTATLR